MYRRALLCLWIACLATGCMRAGFHAIPADPDDRDGDGYGRTAGDCNDNDRTVHPGAVEIPYDGIDQDCEAGDLIDADGDGFHSTRASGGDCADDDPQAKPGGVEICGDGIDQDCNGSDQLCSDDDLDGDGYSPNQGDCNDDDPTVNPNRAEQPYNGKDDDCAVATPDDDLDGDGYAVQGVGDCDDGDAEVHPWAAEVAYDGVDQDCDGEDLDDLDGDGYAAEVAGGSDCDDDDPAINPAGVEQCGDDVDQDCSGADLPCTDDDNDGDGFSPNEGDCNDDAPDVNPGRDEVPYNQVDDDCNAATPDDDLDGDGYSKLSGDDCDDGDPYVNPGAAEVPYDGVDQDCSDGDLVDVDGDGYDGEPAGGPDCDDTDAAINPAAAEIPYDGVDQDCDESDLVLGNSFGVADADSFAESATEMRYLVAYQHGTAVRGELLDVVGSFQLSLAIGESSASPPGPATASAAKAFIVVWPVGDKIWARIVSAGGKLGDALTVQQTTKSIETLQVARVDELHYAVVWSEGPTLWLRYLLTDSGEPSGAAIELSNSFPPDATPPALAAGPKGLLVAWHVDDGKEGDIHGVLVDGPTVGPSFPISAAPAAQRAPRAVFAGGRFLVVWIDARGKVPSVFGQLLDPNGAPVRSPVDQNLELAPTSGPVTATALTGCHGRFDVLFADARYGKSALFLQRVDGDGTLLGGNEGEVLYAGEDAVLGADVSCTADEPLATILVGPKLVALPFKP